MIKEHIHFVGESSAHIDLFFTMQPYLVLELKDHSSVHPKCHHHLNFAKSKFKIHYLPSCEQETWHYHKAYVDQIRQAASKFSGDNRFINIDMNKQLQLLIQTTQKITFPIKQLPVLTEIHHGQMKTIFKKQFYIKIVSIISILGIKIAGSF